MNVGAHFTSHRLTSGGSRGKVGSVKLVWPAGRDSGCRTGRNREAWHGQWSFICESCIINEPDFRFNSPPPLKNADAFREIVSIQGFHFDPFNDW